MIKKLLVVPAVMAMFLLLASFAQATGYLKVGDIKGESTDEGHKDWINLGSYQWEMSQQTTGASSRLRGGVVTEDILITKEVDKSTPKLMEAVATGKVIPEATLELTRESEGRRVPYLKYELQNVRVVSYSVNGAGLEGDTVPTEQMALNFEEIKVEYSEQDETGAVVGVFEFLWNFLKNTR